MNILNDIDLEGVAGGTNAYSNEKAIFGSKKEEFEAAWDALQMEKKGFTGNMRAELFDDWEAAENAPSAVRFLSKIK